MKPPTHLSDEAKKIWRRISREYHLTADAAMLLQTALEHRDIADRAREILEREGLVTIDGKRHAAADVMKASASIFLRAVRQLGLDIEPAQPIGRPPTSAF